MKTVRMLVIELAKRRLGRTGEARPVAVEGEEHAKLVRPKRFSIPEEGGTNRRLDKWVKKKP